MLLAVTVGPLRPDDLARRWIDDDHPVTKVIMKSSAGGAGLAIGNALEARAVCYCENEGSTMGFTSKPVRVIEIPEPMSEPLLAPESEPQRTEREEEVPVTTPA
jgi:hypothetical protein